MCTVVFNSLLPVAMLLEKVFLQCLKEVEKRITKFRVVLQSRENFTPGRYIASSPVSLLHALPGSQE